MLTTLLLVGLMVGGRWVYLALDDDASTTSHTLNDPPQPGSTVFCGNCHTTTHDEDNMQSYTISQQRSFLETYGWNCQQPFASTSTTNLLLKRYNELPSAYNTELFKYCALYLGVHSVYWDRSASIPLVVTDELLLNQDNVAIALSSDDDFLMNQPPLHHSFLKVKEPKSKVALGMMRFLLETDHLTPTLLQETLSLFVANDIHKKRSSWTFWTSKCLDGSSDTTENIHIRKDAQLWDVGRPCAAQNDEPCCQVFHSDENELPLMTLTHQSFVGDTSSIPSTNPVPFSLIGRDSTNALSDDQIGMPVDGLPYIATVREYRTNAPPATIAETPNYFDILLRNNCLPRDKECFKCLKLGYKEGDEGGDCRVCEEKCPCYCKALCQVRPPPKRLAAEWQVTLPRYRKDPSRLVPRIIHQTWFEPVSKDKYPNMSRLIESFRQSGWEYEFYDDDQAAQFLSAHFPPQVREAYDAIIPGAFKADLFRYCVLLIRGGVYADMDILLETNLDQAIDPSIGFLVPQDSPGETIGARSCLWNGLMAVAPGHPFMLQTIQNVVNNVRNRFTSVDYDDMLCPNPVLSVSHTVDTVRCFGLLENEWCLECLLLVFRSPIFLLFFV